LVVAQLEHIAKWEQIRGLAGQPSSLTGAIRLDVYEAAPGEERRPEGRIPLAMADGGYQLVYSTSGGTNPAVFMTLTNTTDRPLWVALLDLTDRFKCDSSLFQTAPIAAGHTAVTYDGAPIPVTLPDGRAVRPGAIARDWLMVVVSSVEFNAASFDLPQLGEPATRSSAAVGRARSTLERLAGRALTRDMGDKGPPPPASEWCATTIPLTTVVP